MPALTPISLQMPLCTRLCWRSDPSCYCTLASRAHPALCPCLDRPLRLKLPGNTQPQLPPPAPRGPWGPTPPLAPCAAAGACGCLGFLIDLYKRCVQWGRYSGPTLARGVMGLPCMSPAPGAPGSRATHKAALAPSAPAVVRVLLVCWGRGRAPNLSIPQPCPGSPGAGRDSGRCLLRGKPGAEFRPSTDTKQILGQSSRARACRGRPCGRGIPAWLHCGLQAGATHLPRSPAPPPPGWGERRSPAPASRPQDSESQSRPRGETARPAQPATWRPGAPPLPRRAPPPAAPNATRAGS